MEILDMLLFSDCTGQLFGLGCGDLVMLAVLSLDSSRASLLSLVGQPG
jgi:hypothetical protein